MTDQIKSLDLINAVSINEILKNVIAIAGRLDLVAFNAVLVAKRAGKESVGFHVVASELRAFGKNIEAEMADLDGLIRNVVRRIVALRKSAKNLRLLELTASKNDQSKILLQDKLTEKSRAYQIAMENGESEWLALENEIRRALRLCRRGAMLSNNGRIEAAYGKAFHEEMNQVACVIDEIMGRVVGNLKMLSNSLNR